MQNMLNRITNYSIYLVVFLLPIFFLPFSFEVFEYAKQYLLFFLVSLAFLAWVMKMVVYDKEIRFRHTPLDYIVLGFLAVAVLSAIFSVDGSSSLSGFYGRFSNGLVGLLSLGALYFLITNKVQYTETLSPEEKGSGGGLELQKILNLFLWACALAVLTGYFSVLGILAKIASFLALPKPMAQRTFNPVAGSLEGLSVFLSVVAVLAMVMLLVRGEKKRLFFLYLMLFAILGLMAIVDFTPAWLILLVTSILFVGFSMWRRFFKENVNLLLIPMILIVIAGVLIPLKPVKMGLAQEQILPQQISWNVAFKSAVDNVKSGFIGSGIGTFHYDFSKYKPQSINQTWLWQIRFDRGTHFSEILATMGFLGLLFYLGIAGFFFLIFWFLVSRQFLSLPFVISILALLVGQFVYYQNTSLAFAFWLMLGLSVASLAPAREVRSEKTISLKKFQELSLVLSTLVIVLASAVLALYFYAVKFYLADVNYSKGILLLGEERIKKLEKAVNLNPGVAQYRTALARAYLYEALLEMGGNLAEQDAAKIQLEVSRAIEQAQAATVLAPSQVASWEVLGVTYREIRGVAAGAIDWGIKSFEKAIVLEPTNPVLYVELGKLYSTLGQTEKAKDQFRQALEKKPDYADALLQEALILEREEGVGEAIAKLESAVIANSFNVEALFQLGRLYFNNGRVDEAIGLFERVVILVPSHSNAHYSLGVAYAFQGKKDLAIKEFEAVLELNPGNQDVIQKLENLRGD